MYGKWCKVNAVLLRALQDSIMENINLNRTFNVKKYSNKFQNINMGIVEKIYMYSNLRYTNYRLW